MPPSLPAMLDRREPGEEPAAEGGGVVNSQTDRRVVAGAGHAFFCSGVHAIGVVVRRCLFSLCK